MNTLTGHSSYVRSVAISPDGRLLASGSDDMTVKLWSLPGGTLLKTLTGHTSWVWSVAIGPDGRLLTSGSLDGTVRLWSLPDGALLKTLSVDTGVYSIAISPDGRLLASGSSGISSNVSTDKISLWLLPDGKQFPVCLMDPVASDSNVGGATYTMGGKSYTVLCGTPLPAGAVCTCNCVPGCSCVSLGGGGCGVVTYYYPN